MYGVWNMKENSPNTNGPIPTIELSSPRPIRKDKGCHVLPPRHAESADCIFAHATPGNPHVTHSEDGAICPLPHA